MKDLSLELPIRVKRLPSAFTADLWAMAGSMGITMELVRNRLSLTSVLQNQNLLCSSSLGNAWAGRRLRSLDSNSVSFVAFLGPLDHFLGSIRNTEPSNVYSTHTCQVSLSLLEASMAPHCLEVKSTFL